MKLLILIFVLFFYTLVILFRSFLLYKQTGINPMKLKHDDTAQGFNALVFSVIVYSVLGMTLLYAVGGNYYDYLVPVPYLDDNITLKIVGFSISLLAMIWIFIAQLQMRQSWRIGIDYSEKNELITHGLFSISRNPIFLGILISYIGFFLLMPNTLSFGVGFVSFVSISIQIRLEESYLSENNGREYLGYKAKVRRWLGQSK